MPNQHTGAQPRDHLPHCPVVDSERCPECGSANVRKGGMMKNEMLCMNKIMLDGQLIPCACYWELPHNNTIQEGMKRRVRDNPPDFGIHKCAWPGCKTMFQRNSNNHLYAPCHKDQARRRMWSKAWKKKQEEGRKKSG